MQWQALTHSTSIHPSVRRSIRPLRLFNNCVSQLFLASARMYTESNDRYTCFERLLWLLCQIFQQFVYLLSLFIHLSNTISANFAPRKDTVRTHRCPVGLVKTAIPFSLLDSSEKAFELLEATSHENLASDWSLPSERRTQQNSPTKLAIQAFQVRT